jgi:hypothetical protein
VSLSPILYIRDLRRLLPGWSNARVKSFLRRQGIAREDADKNVYTTTTLLGDVVPDILRALEAKASADRPLTMEDFSDLLS